LDRRLAGGGHDLGSELEDGVKGSVTVSVAIATYNRAGMVRQAIEAALDQTRAPDEIVVADDASTDSTWAALEELAGRDSRVRIFQRGRNSGGVENWNFAIGQTRGDYIAWCSDDDRFTPGHLEASVEYLEAHPGVGLVHAGFIDVIEVQGVAEGAAQQLARPLRFPHTRIVTKRDLIGYLTRYYDWPFHPSTLVLRREVWERVGLFNPAYALADTDWFVRAVEQFPAAMLARHGVYNRRHAGNWSNRLGSARMQREILEIVEGAIDRLHSKMTPRDLVWKAAWKVLWRMNVRMRLLLTLRARLKSGHADAACAAWNMLMRGTGLKVPKSVAHAGRVAIRRWCGRREAEFEDARQSVSPL
jgi:glycosyltransferase involved in cell wall biosynthesis